MSEPIRTREVPIETEPAKTYGPMPAEARAPSAPERTTPVERPSELNHSDLVKINEALALWHGHPIAPGAALPSIPEPARPLPSRTESFTRTAQTPRETAVQSERLWENQRPAAGRSVLERVPSPMEALPERVSLDSIRNSDLACDEEESHV